MVYLLLDTNILISLISEPREEYLIERLTTLTVSGDIVLLVPEILVEEWERKKRLTVKKLKGMFSDSEMHSHNTTLREQLRDDMLIIDRKVAGIDALLSQGCSYKLYKEAKLETVDRCRKREPPFHGDKTKNFNDALMFFSSVHYLKRRKINSFAFVTRDVSDFGDPENKMNALHPGLEVKGLSVDYFSALEKCLYSLNENGTINYQRKIREDVFKYIINVADSKNKNLLEYLYEVLTICQKKMRFIPPDIFCRIHPFRIKTVKYNYSYHSNQVLYTNNLELVNFFLTVDIQKKRFKPKTTYRNTIKNLQKLTAIIDILNRQYVFLLSLLGSDKEIYIRPEEQGECNCTRCLFSKLQWHSILNEKFINEDLLKMAFVQFQFGFNNTALKKYYSNYREAKENNNKIFAYQQQYNLLWLNQHIEKTNDEQIQKISREVALFNNQQEYFSFANAPQIDREIAHFYQSGLPIRYFEDLIRSALEDIRKHYQLQLRAGYSSNSHIKNLLNSFALFEEFTLANAMTYTRFSEFSSICDAYVEGVFLSYSLNSYQISRLKYFDDFILRTLLQYGQANKMIELYNRHVKKDIQYKQADGMFLSIAANMFENKVKVIKYFEEVNAWQGSILFYKMFWNLLLLMSLIKFKEHFVKNIYDNILPFLEILPKRELDQLNHFGSFIRSNGKTLGKERLKTLFNLCCTLPHLHNDSIFDAFADVNKKTGFIFLNSQEDFQTVCKLFIGKCDKCNHHHDHILFTAYQFSSDSLKSKLSKMITKILSSTRDFEMFYLSSIYDIIDYRLFIDHYLSFFKLVERGNVNPFAHLQGEVSFRRLNKFLDIVFKNDVQLPSDFLDSLKGISDYYDWLLNMEQFDYNKFNPLWIIQYPTHFFLKKAFSSIEVCRQVKNYLKSNNQPTLANYFVQYVSKS